MPVLGEGPLSARGVLVGESPGRDEAERGRPFVGPTGGALDDKLLEVKLRRSDLFILNAMCCQPPLGKTLMQMRQAADACRPSVIGQLAKLRTGFHVLSMGKYAKYSLTGKQKGLKNGRGFLREWSLDVTREEEAKVVAKLEKKKKSEERKRKLASRVKRAALKSRRGPSK